LEKQAMSREAINRAIEALTEAAEIFEAQAPDIDPSLMESAAECREAIAALQHAGQGEAVATVGENQALEWLPPYRRPPVGTNLYTTPQPAAETIPECHGIWKGKRTEDMSNKELRAALHELSLVAYRLADQIEAQSAVPEAIEIHTNNRELPGMWDESDLSGGWADTEDTHQAVLGGRVSVPIRKLHELMLHARENEDDDLYAYFTRLLSAAKEPTL
jgi:hypothetical protein